MPAKSHKLGPGSLTFGETASRVEFATRLRSVAVEPEVDEEDPIPVLSGDEIVGDDEESYTLTGSILQDYDKDSLLVWAHVHAGKVVPFEFTPDNDKALGVKGQVKVRRIQIGGDVKERNESDFEFMGVGMYDLIDAATGDVLTWTSTLESSTPDSEPTDPTDWH